MALENINAAIVTQGINTKFYTDKLASYFDEFLRLKPSYESLPDIFFSMLEDATKSYVSYFGSMNGSNIIIGNIEVITNISVKYAKMYFILNRDETPLLLLRASLYDIIRKYNYDERKHDVLVHNLYEGIRKLITV